MERLSGEPSHVAQEAWRCFGRREPYRPMTDLQRVQDSLRRFGLTRLVDPSTDGGGIVLTVSCALVLAEADDPTDRIVSGIWRSNPDVRTRLVFDDDGRLLSDRSSVNGSAKSAP